LPDAVVFDLDGVLVESEQLWDAARRRVSEQQGGRWTPEATAEMQGMSAPEWSRYMSERLGVNLTPEQISAAVVEELAEEYRRCLPLVPGAIEAVLAVAECWPLGLASSSNAEIIELFLDLSGLRDRFAVHVASEQVGRGKPAPDVYLEAARRLRVAPERCVAVEDSGNGLRAAAAAHMAAVAVPNPAFPPDRDGLALAAVTIAGISELTPAVIRRAAGEG
jgi:HAD superfamily hydrolase (TIGR01509 family)